MTESPNAARTWPGDHVVSLDIRSLAAFRMLFGFILIFDCLIRWWDGTAHYSDQGLLPRSVLLSVGWHPNFLSLHMANGQPWFINSLFILQTVAAVALLVGYRTRWATLLSWVLLISIHNRNPWVLNGGDVYARAVLFWMLFLPWGQCWSWDAKQGRPDQSWWMGSGTSEGLNIRSFAGLGVLVQVCLLYWFAALPKTHPSWVGDYSAINISLHLDHLVKPFGIWFREVFSTYLPWLTWAVFKWEVWGPFLLWFPFDRGQVRTLALLIFASLHMGFELCFEIGLFPAYCLSVLLVLLPSWFWDSPARWLTKKSREHLIQRKLLQRPTTKVRRLVEATYLFLVFYISAWNFGNEQFRPSLWLPDSLDWIGYTLRLDQRWNMFSPSPPYQDGWWVIKGIRQSGKEVNLLYPGQDISWEKPGNISQTSLTQRRRRWMMELRTTASPELMASFSRFLCAQVNNPKPSLHNVKTVELYYMLEMTQLDGTETPARQFKLFEYDNSPPKPTLPPFLRHTAEEEK